jgi:hypothetical protein
VTIFVDQPLDPKKAECSGLFLYGSGYMASDDVRMAIVSGQEVRETSFCTEQCPVRERCEEKHRERVMEAAPDDVERFEREVAAGRRRGYSREFIGIMRMRQGNPDPFYKAALANFRKGAADRRRVSGSPLVKRG